MREPGFLRPKPAGLAALGVLWQRVVVTLADALFIAYLFLMSSYCVSRVATGTGSYLLVPWWVLLLVVVEVVAGWQALGTSIAMKATGLSVVDASTRPTPFTRRVARYLAWHVSFLPLLGTLAALWDGDHLAWHDRWTSTRWAKVEGTPSRRTHWACTSWGWSILLALAVTLTAGVFITKVDLKALLTGAPKTGIVWRQLVQPDWSLLSDGLSLLTVTLFMALMATLFAILFAVPLSFLAARNLMRGVVGRSVYTIVRGVMSVVRSIEPIVWAIIFVVWVRVGAFPGVLALFVHSIADLVKLYSERLESIDPGPVEAITAAGGNRAQVILYGIIPQIINPYLSFTLYRWDINVRMATIIGVVGGGGIGNPLYLATRQWEWRQAGLYMLLIVVAVWAIDYFSSRLRERLS
jgi:phosphonate transport system permease protein